jgi:hypothetical protein
MQFSYTPLVVDRFDILFYRSTAHFNIVLQSVTLHCAVLLAAVRRANHILSSLLCACDGPLHFRFGPVSVSSVRRSVQGEECTLHGGSVQHSPPVDLLVDPVELAVMQHYSISAAET